MQETVDFEQSYRMVPPSYKLVHNPHELVRYIYHRPQIKSLNSPNQTLHSHLSWPLDPQVGGKLSPGIRECFTKVRWSNL